MKSPSTSLALASLVLIGCGTPQYIHQNDVELEGNAALARSSDDATDTNAFDLSTTVGYSVTDQLQIGVVAVASVERTEADDDSTFDRDILGAGPNLRFNFATSGPVVPFVEAAFGLFSASVKSEDSTGATLVDEDDTGSFVQGGVGARFFVADGASINLAARYRRVQLDDSLGGDIDQYGVLVGLSVFF